VRSAFAATAPAAGDAAAVVLIAVGVAAAAVVDVGFEAVVLHFRMG